jgi:hypothetical protein
MYVDGPLFLFILSSIGTFCACLPGAAWRLKKTPISADSQSRRVIPSRHKWPLYDNAAISIVVVRRRQTCRTAVMSAHSVAASDTFAKQGIMTPLSSCECGAAGSSKANARL